MSQLKKVFASLIVCSLTLSCNNQSEDVSLNQQPLGSSVQTSSSIPYQDKLSPSIIKIINLPDEIRTADNSEITEKEFEPEYVDHYKFFTEIDKTGSGVEEVLEHDGYANAHKYVVTWRKLLGENMDWPDHNSTSYKGPFPALEHGLIKGDKGWFWYSNASKKADEYYNLAVKAWKPGVAPDAPEQKEAWSWLGRTAHFIQDVTVPHHTYSLARIDQLTHHPFEKAASLNFRNYFPSKNYDGGSWNGKGPYPVGDEKWGLYNDKTIAQMIKDNAQISHGLFKIANRPGDANNGNWDKVRAISLPLATKTCAGLIVNFLTDVGETP